MKGRAPTVRRGHPLLPQGLDGVSSAASTAFIVAQYSWRAEHTICGTLRADPDDRKMTCARRAVLVLFAALVGGSACILAPPPPIGDRGTDLRIENETAQ